MNGTCPEGQLKKAVAVVRWGSPGLIQGGEGKVRSQRSSVRHGDTGGSMVTSTDYHWARRKCFWDGRDRVMKSLKTI